MNRSIILALLAMAIIPIPLADAVVTVNREAVFDPNLKTKNLSLNDICTSLQNSAYCGDKETNNTNNIENLEIDSKVWVRDIPGIIFSGSMFSRCRPRNQQQYLNPNIEGKLQSDLTLPPCIFSWQNSLSDEMNLQNNDSKSLSANLDNDPSVSEDVNQLVTPAEKSREFPKISRSSLIVDFPFADSTFEPKDTKLANPAPKAKRIASPFGWRRRPFSYQLQFHQGVDYGAPLGSPVVAVGDGIVTKVVTGCYDFGNLFCGGQLGNWIEVDHGNGMMGIYGHLKNNSITIKEGMKIWKNQQIAEVGSSGWSTGAHLDFRLKVNGKYEDPAIYLTSPNLSSPLNKDLAEGY